MLVEFVESFWKEVITHLTKNSNLLPLEQRRWKDRWKRKYRDTKDDAEPVLPGERVQHFWLLHWRWVFGSQFPAARFSKDAAWYGGKEGNDCEISQSLDKNYVIGSKPVICGPQWHQVWLSAEFTRRRPLNHWLERNGGCTITLRCVGQGAERNGQHGRYAWQDSALPLSGYVYDVETGLFWWYIWY